MRHISEFVKASRESLDDDHFNLLFRQLPAILQAQFNRYTHGQLENWLHLVKQLPKIPAEILDLSDSVRVRAAQGLTALETSHLKGKLQQLKPWRKGPYDIHGIVIDSEWRSDWKWERLKKHLTQLTDRRVLDIGCGNGYHCWRMLGAGAKTVIGIDPSQLFWIQFQTIQHFLGTHPVTLLPIGIEALPESMSSFDTVFSMGVLYHRKSPFEHLQQLKSLLSVEGELILETLVIEGDVNTVLVPKERYASMRNVWFIPSMLALEHWIKKLGFKRVNLIDVNQTSTEEQRKTEWIDSHSLAQFLDPGNCNRTIEGYPAPKRATFIASLT